MGVTKDFYNTYLENTKPFADKIAIKIGKSQDIMPQLNETFDFIYVDGSHLKDDVISDAINAYKLCNKGGIIAFDDYQMCYTGNDGTVYEPKPAIDWFLQNYNVEVIHKGWQVIVRSL